MSAFALLHTWLCFALLHTLLCFALLHTLLCFALLHTLPLQALALALFLDFLRGVGTFHERTLSAETRSCLPQVFLDTHSANVWMQWYAILGTVL